MTVAVMEHGVLAVSDRQPLGVWQEVQSRDHVGSGLGETGHSGCCNHQECETFREKAWCRRLFGLGLGCYDVGRPSNSCLPGRLLSAAELVVRSSLANKSRKDFSFESKEYGEGNPCWTFLVLLAEGEPPITTEEVESWNDDAQKLCSRGGKCWMAVTRGTCCLFKAREALSSMSVLYGSRSVDYKSDLSPERLLETFQDDMRDAVRERGGQRRLNEELNPLGSAQGMSVDL